MQFGRQIGFSLEEEMVECNCFPVPEPQNHYFLKRNPNLPTPAQDTFLMQRPTPKPAHQPTPAQSRTQHAKQKTSLKADRHLTASNCSQKHESSVRLQEQPHFDAQIQPPQWQPIPRQVNYSGNWSPQPERFTLTHFPSQPQLRQDPMFWEGKGCPIQRRTSADLTLPSQPQKLSLSRSHEESPKRCEPEREKERQKVKEKAKQIQKQRELAKTSEKEKEKEKDRETSRSVIKMGLARHFETGQSHVSEGSRSEGGLLRIRERKEVLERMDDVEEIKSQADEDEDLDDDKESVVLGRLNEYASLVEPLPEFSAPPTSLNAYSRGLNFSAIATPHHRNFQ